MEQALSSRLRFGPFELDPRAGELHHKGQCRVLPDQQLKVLLMLIEGEGEIVTREEIKKKLWPNDTVVEFDHSINNTLKNLRRALDDSAENPKYVGTVARRVSADGAGGVDEFGGGFFAGRILPRLRR
jgi:DNA-binding winged helix-turn-helix (wHTH) protein